MNSAFQVCYVLYVASKRMSKID